MGFALCVLVTFDCIFLSLSWFARICVMVLRYSRRVSPRLSVRGCLLRPTFLLPLSLRCRQRPPSRHTPKTAGKLLNLTKEDNPKDMYSFSLVTSVQLMWDTESYWLAIIIVLASGVLLVGKCAQVFLFASEQRCMAGEVGCVLANMRLSPCQLISGYVAVLNILLCSARLPFPSLFVS